LNKDSREDALRTSQELIRPHFCRLNKVSFNSFERLCFEKIAQGNSVHKRPPMEKFAYVQPTRHLEAAVAMSKRVMTLAYAYADSFAGMQNARLRGLPLRFQR
jgi:hypothetical protein